MLTITHSHSPNKYVLGVRFQFWRSGKCRVPLHYRKSQLFSGMGWQYFMSIHSMGQIKLQSATGHLIAPGYHHTLQHILVHFGVDFQADFEDVRSHDVALTWNHTRDHNGRRKLYFHHPVHISFIRGNPAMVLAVITWISREHALYSDVSPISLVEHCITLRHDRRLLSLLGLVHNWPTSKWSATKKENRFSLNGNGIMSSFLGRQVYRSTLYLDIRCYWVFPKYFYLQGLLTL